MGVEMDWRVSTSVQVLVKGLGMVSSLQCTVETTAARYCSVWPERRCCMGVAGGA